jgi:hypothetical protein
MKEAPSHQRDKPPNLILINVVPTTSKDDGET